MFNKRSDKKAQAAMEFLMTYGWAILIILVALGALFYLGVFSPNVSPSCTPTPPINTCDIKIIGAATPGGTLFDLSVNYPNSVTDVALVGYVSPAASVTSIDFDVGGTDCEVGLANRDLASGTAVQFTCDAVHGLTVGDKYSGDVLVEYQLQGSTIVHNARLAITGAAE